MAVGLSPSTQDTHSCPLGRLGQSATHSSLSSSTEYTIYYYSQHLLLLDTSGAGSLGGRDGLLVGLDVAAAHAGSSKHGGGLEGSLEIANGGLAKDVDLDNVLLDGRLDGHDGLQQQRVGVLHVDVHEAHHGDSGEHAPDGGVDLLDVVLLDGGGHELGLLLAAESVGRLDVFESGEIWVSKRKRTGIERSEMAVSGQQPIAVSSVARWL